MIKETSVLEWMHEQVKAQMREHPPGTCSTCDEKRHRRPREDGPTPSDINENETPNAPGERPSK